MTRGKSSQPHPAPRLAGVSLGNHGEKLPKGAGQPGSLNDDRLVRAAIATTIRRCALSRVQIADSMSLLLGQRVTAKMLNSYSADSMTPNRFPVAWQRAFCQATGDDALLRCCAELAGFRLLTQAEVDLLELGREYLRQKRAAEKLRSIEERIGEVEL